MVVFKKVSGRVVGVSCCMIDYLKMHDSILVDFRVVSSLVVEILIVVEILNL
jgi:hypothetical protein